MPKLFKLNQKGIVHLIPLFIILIGIIVGLYLVQHPQIFKPKAAAKNIEFQGSCVAQKDGAPVLTCNNVQIKFTSPLETNSSSDASFQLVKTAYAADTSTSRKCSSLPFGLGDVIQSVSSGGVTGNEMCVFGAHCQQFTKQDGTQDAACIGGTNWPTDPSEKSTGTFGLYLGTRCNGSYKGSSGLLIPNSVYTYNTFQLEKDDNRFEKLVQTCSTESACKETFNPTSRPPFFAKCDYSSAPPTKTDVPKQPEGPTKPQDTNNQCKTGLSIPIVKNGNTWTATISNSQNSLFNANEQVPAEFRAFHCKTAGQEACADNLNISDFDKVLYSQALTINAPAKGTSSSVSTSFSVPDILSKIPAVSCGRVQIDIGRPHELTPACSEDSANIYGFYLYDTGVNCGQAAGGLTAPAPVVPAVAAPAAPGSVLATCANNPSTLKPGERRSGYDWIADCSSSCKVNTDCKGSNPWCYQFQDGFHCMSTRSTVPAAGGPGASATSQRVTKKFRFSESLANLGNAQLYDYTTGGITLSYNFTGSLGTTYTIFVQFLDNNLPPQIIKTDLGQDYAQTSIKLVDYASIPGYTSTNTTPQAPAAAPAAPVNTGTNVCPLDSYQNYNIPTLKQKCSLSELAKLPTSALKSFSNPDLFNITVAVDGSAGPFKFLSQFDNDRLSSFDTAVLKQLPQDRINSLPDNLKNVINGTTSGAAESASCQSIVMGPGPDYNTIVNFTGAANTLKIWVASNSEIGKGAQSVASWSPLKTVSSPVSGQGYSANVTGFSSGSHAVMMSLYGSYGQMLDGNPNDTVNPVCTTTLNVR